MVSAKNEVFLFKYYAGIGQKHLETSKLVEMLFNGFQNDDFIV